MTDSVRKHLPVIVVVSLVAAATAAFALSWVRGQAGVFDVDAFGNWIFGIPCAAMLVGSGVIVGSAQSIGRQLYLVVVGICLAAGLVCMVVTSSWLADPQLSAALLANSAQGAQVVPIVNSPVLVLRDIAAFFVAPTVGCIAGAWIGSRLHPIARD